MTKTQRQVQPRAMELTWSITSDTPFRRLVRTIRGLEYGQLLTISGKGDMWQLQQQLYSAVGKTRERTLRTHQNGAGLEVWITKRST